MVADDLLTLTEPTASASPVRPAPPEAFALVIAWCSDQPDRVGETLIVSGASWSMIGRGGGTATDPFPRLQPVRLRPGRIDPVAPLMDPHLSRLQLRVKTQGTDGIAFERMGRSVLYGDRGPAPIERGLLRPGETLQIGHHLLLLATRRLSWLPAVHLGWTADELRFGQADPLGLIGESPAIWALRERIAFAAGRQEHVLVTGPSGVGKELVARALHGMGSRRALVSRNAATIPEGLIDAEFFGSARNYPHAGMPERPGLIGEANGSSLFLDEIGELPRELQVHLLRVLDAGEYHRLGESQVRQSRFRLIAATNRPLSVFKEDVLARIPLRIEVPDLNQRREDIPLLARHVLRTIIDSEDGAPIPPLSLRLVRALIHHRYTTNVRELRAFLLDALSRRSGPELDWVPATARDGGDAPVAPTPTPLPTTSASPDELHPAHIQRVLDAHRGNIEDARRTLGLSSRHVLARLIARHGLRAGRKWRPLNLGGGKGGG